MSRILLNIIVQSQSIKLLSVCVDTFLDPTRPPLIYITDRFNTGSFQHHKRSPTPKKQPTPNKSPTPHSEDSGDAHSEDSADGGSFKESDHDRSNPMFNTAKTGPPQNRNQANVVKPQVHQDKDVRGSSQTAHQNISPRDTPGNVYGFASRAQNPGLSRLGNTAFLNQQAQDPNDNFPGPRYLASQYPMVDPGRKSDQAPIRPDRRRAHPRSQDPTTNIYQFDPNRTEQEIFAQFAERSSRIPWEPISLPQQTYNTENQAIPTETSQSQQPPEKTQNPRNKPETVKLSAYEPTPEQSGLRFDHF